MVKVPTQTFVVNFLGGAVAFGFWWYFSSMLFDSFYLMAKDPRNFIEVQEKNEADDTEAEDTEAVEDTDAEETD